MRTRTEILKYLAAECRHTALMVRQNTATIPVHCDACGRQCVTVRCANCFTLEADVLEQAAAKELATLRELDGREIADLRARLAESEAEVGRLRGRVLELERVARGVKRAHEWQTQVAHSEDDIDQEQANKAGEDFQYALVLLFNVLTPTTPAPSPRGQETQT